MKQRVKKIWPPFAIPMPITLACVAGLLGALVVIVGDLASTSIPAILKPYVPYAWPVLGVLLLLGIGVAIWDAWYTHRQSVHQTVTSQPASSSSISVAQPASTPVSVPAPIATVSPMPVAASSLYHTCVLSYATEDEVFVKKLYADLQAQGVPCWLAEQDGKLGNKLRAEIYQAIRQLDKLILVLSAKAIESLWMEEEVDVALDREHQQSGTLLLFPVRLDDSVLTSDKYWAITVRQRRIGDLRQWQDDAEYQRALQRLLRDLHV